MYSLHGQKTGWRLAVLLLFGLTPALPGCSAGGGQTLGPAPITPGAVITDAWFYMSPQGVVDMSGTWVHLPASEAGELELWIERAEETCR